MPDLHNLPAGSRPTNAIRNNGPDHLVLERLKLRELAEGWPSYRDACEWENFESIFHPGAYVYTTWSGRVPFTDFIAASKAGMDKGAFIMHRCHGCSTDINIEGTRAVTKLKATITQRFEIDGVEFDVEADCRFCFYFEKVGDRWGARLVRHWYEKDKVIPCNPSKFPKIDEERLVAFPPGYKYLAYFQELTMGVKVLLDMPGHRRHVGTVNLEKHDLLYWQAKEWLKGKAIDV
ncbi:PEP2-like protein [Colletotrichum godetiae]|uniref:PEP2-like protein n=1 Tax=Colletotrichum godetiae TaxID=1209918 RepID=A0AAJ0AZ38_9PEZI|nr:PEP2-like protein [Colletotrichum godetiae]KAK1700961.1 PEP2-like protein [Colletotrichum godetiae]